MLFYLRDGFTAEPAAVLCGSTPGASEQVRTTPRAPRAAGVLCVARRTDARAICQKSCGIHRPRSHPPLPRTLNCRPPLARAPRAISVHAQRRLLIPAPRPLELEAGASTSPPSPAHPLAVRPGPCHTSHHRAAAPTNHKSHSARAASQDSMLAAYYISSSRQPMSRNYSPRGRAISSPCVYACACRNAIRRHRRAPGASRTSSPSAPSSLCLVFAPAGPPALSGPARSIYSVPRAPGARTCRTDTLRASLIHRPRPQARIRDVELSVQRSGPASRVPSTAAASTLQHTDAADAYAARLQRRRFRFISPVREPTFTSANPRR